MLVLDIPLVVDAVVLSCWWPEPKAQEFHCGGVIACVSLLEGYTSRPLTSYPIAADPRCLVLGFTLPGNDELVLVGTGVACIAYTNSTCPLLFGLSYLSLCYYFTY